MPRVEFDAETALPPDRVTTLLTDFSAQRPDTWPGLWEGAYQVFSVGDTRAEIREGNKQPKIWARERYDWSTPGTVRWEVVDSNFCEPGSFVEVKIAPSESGGSKLHVTWSRTPTTFGARLIGMIIVLSRGAPVRASLMAGFRKAERTAT